MNEPRCITIGELARSPAPPFSVTIKEGVIWVQGTYSYPIEAGRITSARDLVAWVHHLSGKPWATRDLISEFIEVVAKAKGIETRIKK